MSVLSYWMDFIISPLRCVIVWNQIYNCLFQARHPLRLPLYTVFVPILEIKCFKFPANWEQTEPLHFVFFVSLRLLSIMLVFALIGWHAWPPKTRRFVFFICFSFWMLLLNRVAVGYSCFHLFLWLWYCTILEIIIILCWKLMRPEKTCSA